MHLRSLRRLAVAAGLAGVIVIAGIVLSTSGSTSPAATPQPVADLFRGIPEHDGVLGDPKAKVTVTEFVDLQCPICAETSRSTLPTLINDYVRTGKVKLAVRALHFIGPDSEIAARAAAGAAQQGRLWPFLHAFYSAQGPENSGYVTDDFIAKVARAAGADASKAIDQSNSHAAQAFIDLADSDAATLGVNATPTFTIASGDAAPKLLGSGVPDLAALRAAIDAELAR